MDAKRVVYGLDELNNRGKLEEGAAYLEKWLNEARAERDERSELTILSEMLGQYRKLGMEEKGLKTCEDAIAMVERQSLESTATGATILLNAATTYSVFGHYDEAIALFRKCEDVYRNTLESGDYRMAGLYNNEASAYMSTGDFESAEKAYFNALEVLKGIDNSRCDRAATYCSISALYKQMGKDQSEIEKLLNEAYNLFIEESETASPYLHLTLSECIGAFEYFGMYDYLEKLSAIKEKLDGIFR